MIACEINSVIVLAGDALSYAVSEYAVMFSSMPLLKCRDDSQCGTRKPQAKLKNSPQTQPPEGRDSIKYTLQLEKIWTGGSTGPVHRGRIWLSKWLVTLAD